MKFACKAPLIAAASLALAACSPTTVDGAQTAVGASEVGGALFVAGKFGNTLSKVDLTTGEEVLQVESCANPHELATSPDDQYVALACYGGATVDIFRTADLGKITSIELGENARPHGIVWHPNGDIYVTAEGRQSIFWIKEPLANHPDLLPDGIARFEYATGKRGSHMLAVAPNGNYAWTTDLGDRTVTLVDLKTRRAPRSVEVGEEPEGIALTPDGGTLWISARGSDKAFALDPKTLKVRSETETGDFPLRIIVRPQGDFAVTSDLADGGLTVIDLSTGQAVRSIAVSSREEAEAKTQVTIMFSPDGERIYVAETRANTVAEVDFASGEFLRRLPGSGGGDGMAIIE